MTTSKPARDAGVHVVHGTDCSYYTGKIEAYLRAKGIAYRLEPFTPTSLRRCARSTGVLQVPQIECPDGSWLIDTTPTIAYLESVEPRPTVTPADPVVRFISLLLEDYADEWLWRPAMHYRWSYRPTARLMSTWLAEHLHEIPVPLFLKRRYFYRRQLGTFVKRDGVTDATKAAVEASYHDTLTAFESILAEQPFLLGARPTQADFGFFASMFRHFFSDPAPARIMRATAPRSHEWVARMWNLRPEALADAPMPDEVSPLLAPLLADVTKIYMPYLAANARAHESGDKTVTYSVQGVTFTEPTKPYRVWCLGELGRALMKLTDEERSKVAAALGDDEAFEILSRPPSASMPAPPPQLPIAADRRVKPLDSWWRAR